jgi:phospholipid/cholesterol/gamma-HCH transport system ATP-binding protein
MPDNIVEVKDLEFSYGELKIFHKLSLGIERNQVVAILGGSGCGKSTLLKLIGGQLRPEGGSIRVEGEEVPELDSDALYRLRLGMGMMFQSSGMFSDMTVYENVAFPLREHTSLPDPEIRQRVMQVLGLVGLGEDVLPKLPSELSGGMRKRVGIARALVIEPEMLLFDEPTAGLDPTNSKMVGDLIVKLKDGVCDTSIVVTHDVELARTVADRVAILMEGRFVILGPVDEVMHSSDPTVQAFLAGEARVTA